MVDNWPCTIPITKFYSTPSSNRKIVVEAMTKFDQVIASANGLSRYIPEDINEVQKDFWNNLVIYNINVNLANQAQARQCVRQCFSIVSSIAKNIKIISKMAVSDRGKFAKKLLPNAIYKLNENLDHLLKIEGQAIDSYHKQIKMIFNVPGADSYTSLDRIVLLQKQINKAFKDQSDLNKSINDNQNEIDSIDKSIYQSELDNNLVQKELSRIKENIAQFNKVVQKLDSRIVGSKRKYVRAQYFINIRRQKMHLLDQLHVSKVDKLNQLAQQIDRLSLLKAQYQRNEYLVNSYNMNEKIIDDLQDKLAELKEDLDNMTNKQEQFERHQDMIGIRNQDYINFLIDLRKFTIAIKDSSVCYAPIITIISEIKSIIESPIELFTSDEQSDVLLAEKLLSRYANYLIESTWSLRACITSYHKKRSWLIIKDVNNVYQVND